MKDTIARTDIDRLRVLIDSLKKDIICLHSRFLYCEQNIFTLAHYLGICFETLPEKTVCKKNKKGEK